MSKLSAIEIAKLFSPILKDRIIIKDWAGNELFSGDYKHPDVDRVLNNNRCSSCYGHGNYLHNGIDVDCGHCDGTGYTGDFEIEWADSSDERNVYEFINY